MNEAMGALIAQVQYLEHFRWEVQDIKGLYKEERERRDVRNLARRLEIAEPFYIAPTVGSLIERGAHSVPFWRLRKEDLLCEHAFIWFPRPLEFDLNVGRVGLAGIQLTATVLVNKLPEEEEGFAESSKEANALKLSCLFEILKPIRATSDVHCPSGHVHQTGIVKFFDQWAFGADAPDGPTEDYGDTSITTFDGLRLWCWARVFSLLAFLRSRIIISQRFAADRITRRLAERISLAPPMITMVTLRHAQEKNHEIVGEPRDWSCRWWVSGHWRQQTCGIRHQERRPTWIVPHLKGPEDKEIRIKKRLFVVVR